jgi:hypothetical protein
MVSAGSRRSQSAIVPESAGALRRAVTRVHTIGYDRHDDYIAGHDDGTAVRRFLAD